MGGWSKLPVPPATPLREEVGDPEIFV